MRTPGTADPRSQWFADSPLYQLVKLKLRRILYSANADSEDMDAGIGVALTVLTLPGAFLSLLLFNKYGSLLRFLRGEVRFDPYAASLPDEYLFIVLAMLVSGGVALWKWDTVFPDRRDLFNIVPLPVHTRQIFVGSLLAILLFGAIFCIDVNAASAVLFPLVVSASQESFLFFGKVALGHGVAIVTASLFTFASVFAIAGIFMAALPARLFQAARSTSVRRLPSPCWSCFPAHSRCRRVSPAEPTCGLPCFATCLQYGFSAPASGLAEWRTKPTGTSHSWDSSLCCWQDCWDRWPTLLHTSAILGACWKSPRIEVAEDRGVLVRLSVVVSIASFCGARLSSLPFVSPFGRLPRATDTARPLRYSPESVSLPRVTI